MFSPISDLARADAEVVALLGAGENQKFYSFGQAPTNPGDEYAVWQIVGGGPANYLAGRPGSDLHVNQVDVYARLAPRARTIARALVRAFELNGYVTSWNGELRDVDTQKFRISFTVEFLTPR